MAKGRKLDKTKGRREHRKDKIARVGKAKEKKNMGQKERFGKKRPAPKKKIEGDSGTEGVVPATPSKKINAKGGVLGLPGKREKQTKRNWRPIELVSWENNKEN